ncbi:zinc ribbon domain-containing protein [Halodesulfurarchaeum formicicum]|uniref:zinc ribbon domain-containing protein n=1 Tax=Halodesulfurarchaeum formicicum TaxID=1873524 RepID=UPI00087872C4|nr:zinc ribbon domain-containing protein [Halodesulfurarchaeum formicicum]
MLDQHWQIGLLLVIGVLHLLVYLQFRRLSRETSTDTAEPTSERPDEEQEFVVCPECGAANEQGYRYCRVCLTELPKTGEHGREKGHSFGMER